MAKKLLLLLSIIIINFQFTKEDSCQMIQCNDTLEEGICVKVESKTS